MDENLDPAATRVSRAGDHPTRFGVATATTFVGALAFALVTRGRDIVVGLAVLSLIFVPIEKVFALRRQKVFRRGLFTDLAHLLVNNLFATIGTVALVITMALPLVWLRSFDLAGALPAVAAVVLAIVLVFVGSYWGHRLTHTVPFLWRFHAVHHSIEQMDWVASARLHPIDSAFTQAVTIAPLFLLGYSGGAFAGATVALLVLALFQHANTRLRFPVIRWIVNTPEWHHWHHAIDDVARDKNFGLPVVDKLFGTAYMPADARPTGFGVADPVPPVGYLRQMAYPFTKRARA